MLRSTSGELGEHSKMWRIESNAIYLSLQVGKHDYIAKRGTPKTLPDYVAQGQSSLCTIDHMFQPWSMLWGNPVKSAASLQKPGPRHSECHKRLPWLQHATSRTLHHSKELYRTWGYQASRAGTFAMSLCLKGMVALTLRLPTIPTCPRQHSPKA